MEKKGERGRQARTNVKTGDPVDGGTERGAWGEDRGGMNWASGK